MDEGGTYTRSNLPDPKEMSPRYTQPGRKWIPLHRPYKSQLDAEICATADFEWLGLVFSGDEEPRVFALDDLKPATKA
jgi:hypothetical protein